VIVLVVLEGVVLLLLLVLVVGLLRSHAEILRRLHELGAGLFDDEADARASAGVTSPVELGERPGGAPDIRTRPGVPEPRPDETPARDVAGTTPDGGARSIRVVGAEHATLLAFLSSGCGTCLGFWTAFADGEGDRLPGRDTRLVIVTKGAEDESLSAVRSLTPPGVTTIMSSGAYDDYGVPVSPYFILVDGPTGQVVGEGAAGSWAQVANLLGQAAADAGLALDGASLDAAARQRRRQGGPERAARADAELLRAGITPGHASLYPQAAPADGEIGDAAATDVGTGAGARPPDPAQEA
jgi:hypothetical protein